MITLSSDFGSPYPAAMKGVILQRTDARLVDVTHNFPRQDVRSSAFWLREVLPYFPSAVHLVVVDPGVGTDRKAVVVRACDHALVGPDNGVLIPVARRLAGEEEFEVFEILETGDGPAPTSSTFHGRDVFAPAAARVHAAGVDSFDQRDGFEPVETYEDLRFPVPTHRKDGVTGTVLAVDRFGNVITNIAGESIDDRRDSEVTLNGLQTPIRETYAEVDTGERVITVGSHGNVELAVNQGRGDEAFDVGIGDRIELSYRV